MHNNLTLGYLSKNRSQLTMENPFYGGYWSQPARPRYSSNMSGIPVQSIHQKPAGIKPAAKVVQIPVHSVRSGPERSVSASTTQKPDPDRSASALRIQKVFRGFLVRKSVKRIMSIRKEVDDIERKLLCSETAELIRRDERERLRVNEMLMSLLFKLDSISGVDSGVRDCRKAVIKRPSVCKRKLTPLFPQPIKLQPKRRINIMIAINSLKERMMNEVCQRNETQTRMLNSLAQRVDQLEKIFLLKVPNFDFIINVIHD